MRSGERCRGNQSRDAVVGGSFGLLVVADVCIVFCVGSSSWMLGLTDFVGTITEMRARPRFRSARVN